MHNDALDLACQLAVNTLEDIRAMGRLVDVHVDAEHALTLENARLDARLSRVEGRAAEVLQLHLRDPDGRCGECAQPWPCRTVKAACGQVYA